MWFPATIPAPSVEPVTLDDAKAHGRIDGNDEDELINAAIAAARSHLEQRCGQRFAPRTGMVRYCSGFADLARLPEAPVTALTSIAYIDTAGASQTLATSVYEFRGDGIEPSVVLKYNQTWPAIQPRSRIAVTFDAGYAAGDLPEDVKWAMFFTVSHFYENRNLAVIGASVAELPMQVDSLLSNHTRYP